LAVENSHSSHCSTLTEAIICVSVATTARSTRSPKRESRRSPYGAD
jgi:hypothetical protein